MPEALGKRDDVPPRLQEALEVERHRILLERIAEEGKVFAERLGSAEAKEAFAAFLEKRPADFTKLRGKG